jgi:hypothetical protein
VKPMQAQDATPLMATGNGQSDTHINDGTDYGTITGKDIAARAANPDSFAKMDAPWFIPSTYVDHDARSHDAQKASGLYHILPLDIDKGGPSIDDVVDATAAVLGADVAHIIYSSSSATAEVPKWRVLVFLAQPVSGEDYKDTQEALFGLYAAQGIACDYALARTGQLVFLPNVPPEKRDDDGNPLFYDYRLNRGTLLAIDLGQAVFDRREAMRRDMAAAEAEIMARKSRSVATIRTDGDVSPVEAFNEANSLKSTLERYGYTQQGNSNQWQSPNQSSGSYAVKVFEQNTWVSLSGSDQSAGIGNVKDFCCWGDAFDLFAHYEHAGNHTDAVRAYGAEIRPSAIIFPLNFNTKISDDTGQAETPTTEEIEDPKRKKDGESPLTEWAFLSGDNEFYHMATGRSMSVNAFNLAMPPLTPRVGYEKDDGEVVQKKFPPAKTLVEYLDGIVAHSTMYRPDVDAAHFDFGGIPFVNNYRTDTVPIAAVDWEAHNAWRICEKHIQNILGDDADILIKWMAHNVQFAGRKILWAPIIVGVQGDGKTTLAKILAMAMGAENVSPVSPETMFSDFTGWAEGACVKVLEEIRIHGNSRHNAMNKLKPLITNDVVEVVRKGRDGKQVVNVTNYIALTNYIDALALDEGDRRWGVFKTKFESREDMLMEFNDAYWKALHGAIDGNPDVLRGWLLSVSLDGFNRTAGPDANAHKTAMINHTRSADQIDVEESIAVGWHGVTSTVLTTDCLNGAIFSSTMQRFNGKRLSNVLEAIGWVKFPDVIKWNGKTRRVWFKKSARLGAATPAEIREILDTSEAQNAF